MNIDLTPELEAFVERKVASGLYSTRSEVVTEALRLLAERDRLRERHVLHLRKALTEGLAQADRGERIDGCAVVAQVKRALRRRR